LQRPGGGAGHCAAQQLQLERKSLGDLPGAARGCRFLLLCHGRPAVQFQRRQPGGRHLRLPREVLRGLRRARSYVYCRCALLLIHFIPESLTYSVTLFLIRQRDRTLGLPGVPRQRVLPDRGELRRRLRPDARAQPAAAAEQSQLQGHRHRQPDLPPERLELPLRPGPAAADPVAARAGALAMGGRIIQTLLSIFVWKIAIEIY
jgi:hypothetical protein